MNLMPVITWLENGCDPKEAAKELRIYQQQMCSNEERLDWIGMYGSFGVDSVSGIPGGNGQKRVAATRSAIDAAMLKTPNARVKAAAEGSPATERSES